tara:strand:+ start:873 stop:1202 length:330 start_codon:yes stop_codon:yes gene_type:complete
LSKNKLYLGQEFLINEIIFQNMKNILLIMLLIILSGCASTNWTHQNSNNSKLSFDKGECRAFANSKSPTYLCKNPFYCEPEEWAEVITSISTNNATFDYCMYKKGYKLN